MKDFKVTSVSLTDGVNKVHNVSVDTTKKMQTHYKNHYKAVGWAFQNMSHALEDTRNRKGTAELRVRHNCTKKARKAFFHSNLLILVVEIMPQIPQGRANC